MTYLFQVRRAHLLLLSLVHIFSTAHTAIGEEGSDASYMSGSPRLAFSFSDRESHSSSSTRCATPIGFDLRSVAPWKLSQVIVESWGLTELSDIGLFTETALQLQHAFQSDDLVSGIMTLGARYIHEVRRPDLSIQDMIYFLNTLATLEESYPRAGLRTSKFAYEMMIDRHREHHTNLCTWEEQSRYLWSSAYTFHKTGGDADLTREILSHASHWILGWHTPHHQNLILDLITQVVLAKPHDYSEILDTALERTSQMEAFELIPFLQGVVFTLPFIDSAATFSPLSSSTPQPSSSEEGTPWRERSPYLPQQNN